MNILSFDIGGTAVKFALMNEKFEIITDGEFPSDAKLGGGHIISLVCQRVAAYPDAHIIAISTAGQVDADNGKIIYANENIPQYTGFDVKNTVESCCGKKTYVENDAICAATGEAVFGAGIGKQRFLCLTYGTGVGGSLFFDGSVYKGKAFNTGEIGHIITHSGGRKCGCGGTGCYEAYASCSVLTDECTKVLKRKVNAKEIFTPELYGLQEIRNIIDRWTDEVALGIQGLVQMLSVTDIVVGGGVMNESRVLEQVRKKVNLLCSQKHGKITVTKAKLGNKAGLYGAAHIALKKYMEER